MEKEIKNTESFEKDLDIVYLSKENSEILPLNDEFISLKKDGKLFERVSMLRTMPFSRPDEYIVVKDKDNNELGIIKTISDFDDKQKELILRHLAMRYYCPKIFEIVDLKDKFGFIYVTVLTDSGRKSFASSDLTKSIKRISGEKYIIVDVEGNRFMIEDLKTVKNYKKLLAFIV